MKRQPCSASGRRNSRRSPFVVEDMELDPDDELLFSFSFEEFSDEEASPVAARALPPPLPDLKRAAVANVTLCDADALECGVCFLTLRPPIFQCEVGHVVCSACRDKLEATGNGKCHVCGVATRGAGGYRRCHAMEHLLDSIRIPCPYSAHGCDAAPPYHGVDGHRQACRHAPCRCPGESCGFVGSTTALLDHFAGAHNWPCTTKVKAGKTFTIRLSDGFNFFLLEQTAATTSSSSSLLPVPCLFMLNVKPEQLGRAVSVLCIHPHASAAAVAATAANGGAHQAQQLLSTQCELVFSRKEDGSLCRSHKQSSVFKVACTDLSDGLPSPDGCFHFFVHKNFLGDGNDRNSIEVRCRIIN